MSVRALVFLRFFTWHRNGGESLLKEGRDESHPNPRLGRLPAHALLFKMDPASSHNCHVSAEAYECLQHVHQTCMSPLGAIFAEAMLENMGKTIIATKC